MADYFCDRCGDYLPEGCVRYRIHIHILPDFEELLSCDDDPEDFCDQCAHMACSEDCGDSDEVSQEIALVLCEDCKKKFARDPCSKGTGPFRLNRKVERLFH